MAECLAGLPWVWASPWRSPWVWVWGGYGDRNSVPTAALMSRPVGFASHSRPQPQHHGVVHAVSARRAGAIVHRCGGGGGGRHALLSVIKLGNTAAEEPLSRAVESPTLTSPRLPPQPPAASCCGAWRTICSHNVLRSCLVYRSPAETVILCASAVPQNVRCAVRTGRKL